MYYDKAFDDDTKKALSAFSSPTGENPRLFELFKLKIQAKQNDYAIELLNRYPSAFEPNAVLNELPKNTPITIISDFLINSVKNITHRYHEAIITKNLETTLATVLRQERSKIEMTYVKIERESMCDKTGEPIGDQPFYSYPNGTIVLVDKKREYDKNICPMTGRNFKEKPWDFEKNH